MFDVCVFCLKSRAVHIIVHLFAKLLQCFTNASICFVVLIQFRRVMPCCRFQTIESTSVVFANIHIKCCDLDRAVAPRDGGENVMLPLSQIHVDGLV